MASFADAALLQLEGFGGQAAVAVAFAGFWAALIEYIRWPMHRRVLSAAWWPRALPAQLNIMANFGYDRDATTADMAAHGFVWVLTMCLTHVVSAALMAPVVALGWDAAGALGRLLFFVGTLSEVGFDVYDTIKSFLLTFFQHAVPQLGPAAPLKPFILICVLHHSTVLAMAVPMNLYYPDLAAYHQMAFSLLVSAGVCYLAGQYKFTLDAKCPSDLLLIKMIMVLQFSVNWLTRVFMWFPAVYSTLLLLHGKGNLGFFAAGACGALGMSLYNLLIAFDATQALLKWLPRTAQGKAE